MNNFFFIYINLFIKFKSKKEVKIKEIKITEKWNNILLLNQRKKYNNFSIFQRNYKSSIN